MDSLRRQARKAASMSEGDCANIFSNLFVIKILDVEKMQKSNRTILLCLSKSITKRSQP